ncbi:MAG TPA: AMP-binding protein, partial [Aestuariivirga sp.]
MTDATIRSASELPIAAKPNAVTDILAGHAASRPEVIFIFDPFGKYKSLTYAETWHEAWVWFSRLKSAGVRQADVVHLALGNGTDFVGAFFGTLLLGALAAPMPPRRGANAEDFTLSLRERKLPGHK